MGLGERKIADRLGVTHWAIRTDRAERIEAVHIVAPPSEGPKVLIYDIETSFKVGAYWGPEYDTSIAKRLADWQLLTFAYKWEGQAVTNFVGTWQDPKWSPSLFKEQDGYVAERLWQLYDEADVVIAHNGDKFDQKKANARFLRHGMTPPSPYVEVDTLKLSRTFFGLSSHKLDALAAHLELEGKVSHEGIDLWESVMLGDKEAQSRMMDYNIRDVDLLEEVFEKIEPWVGFNGKGRKFNRALWKERGTLTCPNCGGYDLVSNGFRETATTRKQSYLCRSIRKDGSICGARPTERTLAAVKKGVVLN